MEPAPAGALAEPRTPLSSVTEAGASAPLPPSMSRDSEREALTAQRRLAVKLSVMEEERAVLVGFMNDVMPASAAGMDGARIDADALRARWAAAAGDRNAGSSGDDVAAMRADMAALRKRCVALGAQVSSLQAAALAPAEKRAPGTNTHDGDVAAAAAAVEAAQAKAAGERAQQAEALVAALNLRLSAAAEENGSLVGRLQGLVAKHRQVQERMRAQEAAAADAARGAEEALLAAVAETSSARAECAQAVAAVVESERLRGIADAEAMSARGELAAERVSLRALTQEVAGFASERVSLSADVSSLRLALSAAEARLSDAAVAVTDQAARRSGSAMAHADAEPVRGTASGAETARETSSDHAEAHGPTAEEARCEHLLAELCAVRAAEPTAVNDLAEVRKVLAVGDCDTAMAASEAVLALPRRAAAGAVGRAVSPCALTCIRAAARDLSMDAAAAQAARTAAAECRASSAEAARDSSERACAELAVEVAMLNAKLAVATQESSALVARLQGLVAKHRQVQVCAGACRPRSWLPWLLVRTCVCNWPGETENTGGGYS